MFTRKRSKLPFDNKGGVVVIQRRLIESTGYLRLSSQAKALIHLMQAHWQGNKPVAYGVREAMEKIPCAKTTAMTAFKELEQGGFIEMIDNAWFDSRTQSKARTWRLTWLPWMGKPPTNDWEKTAQRV